MLEQQQARPPDIGGQRQGLALHRALRVALRRRRLDLVVKGFDRTSPLHVEGGKVCNRRNLVVPARSGEGPLIHPDCRPSPLCGANRRSAEFTTYALAAT